MEVVVTPRFHKIGESRKNLKLLKEKSKKRRHSVEYVANIKKLKNKSKKKAKNSEKIKDIRINDIKSINNIFFHKFILRNDFDQDHCIKFLKEKHVYMEKPKFFEEICN